MSVELELQIASAEAGLPARGDFQQWVSAALLSDCCCSVAIRLVDLDESRQLNRVYRGKDMPTNVLSFVSETPVEIADNCIGDLVICAPVVMQEAVQQHKPSHHHWAHMVVHGMLHLQGYDHEEQDEAEKMEQLEREILAKLGIPDPY
jgi:probable rRNA maturation factor